MLSPTHDAALAASCCVHLAETAEERLFPALRREVFPFAAEHERKALTREIWMLEEELGQGHHPFFRRKPSKEATSAAQRRGAGSDACTHFEAEVGQALLDPDLDLVGPLDVDTAGDKARPFMSTCSTTEPSPPTTPLAKADSSPEFWLPVLRRCFSEETDMEVRARLAREIMDLQAATKLPSAHDLAFAPAKGAGRPRFASDFTRSCTTEALASESSGNHNARFQRYATWSGLDGAAI